MFTLPRLGLVVLAACIAGCSGKPASGALLVVVNLEPGLVSRCVKVTASDGTSSKETKPIALTMKTSLQVAIYGDGLVQPVTVQALGFSDDACTTRTAGEASETAAGKFTSPVSTLTLTLRANANGGDGGRDGGGADGGRDGGVDGGVDAGSDAGFDAGVDLDGDGYPLPADCDDTNPAVHPGLNETSMLCANGLDDDCDGRTDCLQPGCDLNVCMGGGRCMANVCTAPTEVSCSDRMDNDGDMLIDCLDPDCAVGTLCDDGNDCTNGDRCVADGGCEKTMDKLCDMPPADAVCHAAGVCLPDAGAVCSYATVSGTCNDGLACTTGDTCGGGLCTGTPIVCSMPPNSCFQDMGACQATDGGCAYAPRPTGTGVCTDGQTCTVSDSCDGDGGCAGTAVSCPTPSQCQTASTCDVDGGCRFNPRTGLACDAGTGAGTCDSLFACNATPVVLFPNGHSNFAENQLPATGGAFAVGCSALLSTGGTPTIVSTCGLAMPSSAVIVQGGESTLLLRMSSFTVGAGFTLLIAGSRPVIFAVTGNVQLDGAIRAQNGSGLTACGNGAPGTKAGSGNGFGGAGGGGFGSVGGAGGNSGGAGLGAAGAINGTVALIPLRGGCNGGLAGGAITGGAGGGAIQITASGSITVNDIISAFGNGGSGGVGAANGGGGGGSGGAILLESATVVLNTGARVTANGGTGGEGSSGINGVAGNETSSTSTPAPGGTSANGGDGGGGAAGLATGGNAAGPGLNSGNNNNGAGGGGGGVGRIRINATSCTRSGTGQIISPPHMGTACP